MLHERAFERATDRCDPSAEPLRQTEVGRDFGVLRQRGRVRARNRALLRRVRGQRAERAGREIRRWRRNCQSAARRGWRDSSRKLLGLLRHFRFEVLDHQPRFRLPIWSLHRNSEMI
jgi:hypothetical protein